MGTIFYGDEEAPLVVDDRDLAHLKVIVAAKLRRNEGFTLTARHPPTHGGGRVSLWLHPSIPLRFVFDDPEPAALSRGWLDRLADEAAVTGALSLIDERLATTPPPGTVTAA